MDSRLPMMFGNIEDPVTYEERRVMANFSSKELGMEIPAVVDELDALELLVQIIDMGLVELDRFEILLFLGSGRVVAVGERLPQLGRGGRRGAATVEEGQGRREGRGEGGGCAEGERPRVGKLVAIGTKNRRVPARCAQGWREGRPRRTRTREVALGG